LPHLDLARKNCNRPVLGNMETFREARFSSSASALPQNVRNDDRYHESRPENSDKLAAIQLKYITRRFGKLVTLGFREFLSGRVRIHRRLWFSKRYALTRFAADSTALSRFEYPQQRQMLPSSASMISSRDGFGFSRSNATVVMIIPGTQ
jgi:hypothetical protein